MPGRVFVAGSANIDMVATVTRLPRAGETVLASALQTLPGGKGANQAVAAARAGSATTFFGCLGADSFGDQLLRFLHDAGIDVSHVARSNVATGTALIAVADDGQNQIAVFPGANSGLRLAAGFGRAGRGDVLLCQNESPVEVILEFVAAARSHGVTTVHNAAPAIPLPDALLAMVDVLVVNDDEALAYFAMLHHEAEAPRDATELARSLCVRDGPTVIVTLGEHGVAGSASGRIFREPGHKVPVLDTTGAGDCFCGYLASCLAAGASLDKSIVTANAASALAVQRKGAGVAMPTRREVEEFLKDRGFLDSSKVTPTQLG